MKLSKMYDDGQEEYVDDDSAAALESLPESAWAHIVEAGKALTRGGDSPGIDFQVVTTRETIENFLDARRSWNEMGRRVDWQETPRVIIFEDMQALKGQWRASIAVIDFGDVRAVLTV